MNISTTSGGWQGFWTPPGVRGRGTHIRVGFIYLDLVPCTPGEGLSGQYPAKAVIFQLSRLYIIVIFQF